MNTNERLRDLRALARAYLREASTLEYAALTERQARPWPSAAFGAAGVGYALWRATGRDRPRLLDEADRILREAARCPLDDFNSPEMGMTADLRASLSYGPAGVGCVQLLVARARGDEPTYARELAAYLAVIRSRDFSSDEMLFGVAGLLNGARILHRHTGEESLSSAADALSDRLLAGADRWLDGAHWAFAHGTAGILHALLSWCHHTRREPAPELRRMLARFSDRAERGDLKTPAFVGPDTDLWRRTWCNGASGLALLWAKAYESTREERYLTLARSCGRVVVSHRRLGGSDLCCGLGGRGYALLALDRIDRGGAWHEHAVALTSSAALRMRRASGPWPNGLYKGYPGLVCLVGDLARGPRGRLGFPLVEG